MLLTFSVVAREQTDEVRDKLEALQRMKSHWSDMRENLPKNQFVLFQCTHTRARACARTHTYELYASSSQTTDAEDDGWNN